MNEIDEFCSWLAVEKGRSPATLSAYRRDLRAWEQWLGRKGLGVLDARVEHVGAYLAELEAAGRAPSTRARITVSIRGLHRFAAAELGADAVEPDVPGVPRGLPKALSEPQVARLLDAVGGDGPPERRDRAMLETLYGTGLRISELVGLSLGDVDLDTRLLRAFGKGSRERIVPLGRHCVDALEHWLAPGGRPELEPTHWRRRGDAEAVFINQRGGRLTRQGAWLVIGRYGNRAGLSGLLTPHVLRHSCATHMLEHGADIRSVQELLGHVSISSTQRYTAISERRMREVYDASHPRARRTTTVVR